MKAKLHLATDWNLKLLSLLLAVLMWFVVVNAVDPIETKTVSGIEVDILYSEAITAQSKRYHITSPQTVSITLQAKSTDWNQIHASDFRAYVDMRYSYGVQEGNQAARIQIEVVNHQSIIDEDTIQFKSSDVLYFTTENIIERTLPVELEEQGELADNYRLDGLEAQPAMVTVKAPESIMGSVSRVVARVDRSSLSSDMTQVTVAPMILDANDKELKDADLQMNVDQVTVTANVLRTKQITITAEGPSGAPADGYQFSNMTLSQDTITVAGTRTELNNFNHIIIPTEQLSIAGARQSVITEIPLSEFLPDGVSVIGGSTSVTVTMHIEQLQTKTYRIPVSKIALENTTEGYEYAMSGITVPVVVRGLQEDLNLLTAEKLIASADVADCLPGEYTLPVVIHLESGYELIQPVTVQLTVRPQAPEETVPEETNAESDTSEGSTEEESSSTGAGR